MIQDLKLPIVFSFSLALVLAAISCSTSQFTKTTDTVAWNYRMQELASNLYVLFPLVSDKAAFSSIQNHDKIDNSLVLLAADAHEIKGVVDHESQKPADVDPSVVLLAGNFKRELGTAVEAFRKGDTEYARSSTYRALQLCIQCHTRQPNARGQMALLDMNALEKMKPLIRADWLATARQFDQANVVYQEVLLDQTVARNHPAEWEAAAEKAIGIAVKVKNNPEQSLKIISLIENSTSIPHYFKERATHWRRQIADWQTENTKFKLRPNKYEQARSLIAQVRSNQAEPYEDPRNSYIYFLRASALLHSYLSENLSPERAAKAYLLLGECYAVLTLPGEVGLSKNYYESCILQAAHTPIASQCYDHYEEIELTEGFERGTSLPLNPGDHLNYLKTLAFP